MKRYLFYILLLTLITITSCSKKTTTVVPVPELPTETAGIRQSPEWMVRVKTLSDSYIVTTKNIATDSQGNIFTTGRMNAYLQFPGERAFVMPRKTGRTSSDLLTFYVCKQNSKGEVVWVRLADSQSAGYVVKTDDEGYVYVVGWAYEPLRFQANDSLLVLCGKEQSSQFAFVNKYDQQGNLILTKQLVLAEHNIKPNDMVINKNGGITVAGEYDYYPGNTGVDQNYILFRTDREMNVLWKMTGKEKSVSRLNCVSQDAQGNIYAGGHIWSHAFVGDSQLFFQGVRQAFVMKTDSAGVFKWYRMVQPDPKTSTSSDMNTVLCTSKGNVYIHGLFMDHFFLSEQLTSSKDISPLFGSQERPYRSENPSPPKAIPALYGYPQIFVALIDSDGWLKWVNYSKNFGHPVMNKGVLDEEDNIIISGICNSAVFTTKGRDLFYMQNKASDNPFILSYNDKGEQLWLQALVNERELGVPVIGTSKNRLILFGRMGRVFQAGDSAVLKKDNQHDEYFWLSYNRKTLRQY